MSSAHQDPEPDAVQVTTSLKGITTITLSRPSRRNAVDTPTAAKLYKAFVAFDRDPQQKVCVFQGAGGTFCAGYDLHSLAASSGSDPSATTHRQADPVSGGNLGPMGPSRLQLSKPVIAAVAGHAVAGGLELSLLADLRVVEEDAVLGVFCRRWGVPLVDGGTVRLPAIVGLSRALDMILTGRPVGAQEALQMGLANRVVAKGQAGAEAVKLAEELLKWPQECMNVDRNSAYHGVYEAKSFEDAMRREYENGVKVVQKESILGAGRFHKGAGRHGGFSL